MSGTPRIITFRPGRPGAGKFLCLPLVPIRPSRILGLAIVVLFLWPSCAFLCEAAGQAPDTWTVEHFRVAREAERQNDLNKAANEYQLIISHDPRFAGAYLNLGVIYHQQKRYTEAVKVLQTAVTLDPNLLGAQLILGVDDYFRGDFQSALPHLTQALRLKPTDRESAFYLGLTYIALEQPLQAARTLREAAEHYPDDSEIAYQLGLAYLEAIKRESAQVNRMGTESALSHWALGIAAEEKNERVAAVTEYMKALALDPNLADIYSILAVTLQRSGFSDLARIALERYEVLRPADTGVRAAVDGTPQESGVDQVVLTGIREAFLQLIKTVPPPRYDPSTPALADSFVNRALKARLASGIDPEFRSALKLYFQGNYAGAAVAIADSPSRSNDWIVAYLLASTNAKNSEFGAAERVLEERLQPYWDQPSVCLLAIEIQRRLAYAYLDQVMAKQPESVPAKILLAKSYVAAGRDKEALKMYQDILKLAPNHFGIHLAIGQIYENGLEWAPAIEEFREELDIDPANALALTHLGHALTESREPAQAIPILEKLLATNAADGGAYADLGKNLEEEGQREKAIEAYERALTYDPTQFNLHYKLFQLYLKQGKNERAQKELAAFNAAEAKKQSNYRQSIVDLK